MRKCYTAAFKAQVVLELLKEERSVSQISSEYGVHPNQLYQWKAQALKNLPRLFDDEQPKAKQSQTEQKLNELYAEIGRLTTQVNWLKKIWSRRYREVSGKHWWSGSHPLALENPGGVAQSQAGQPVLPTRATLG